MARSLRGRKEGWGEIWGLRGAGGGDGGGEEGGGDGNGGDAEGERGDGDDGDRKRDEEGRVCQNEVMSQVLEEGVGNEKQVEEGEGGKMKD